MQEVVIVGRQPRNWVHQENSFTLSWNNEFTNPVDQIVLKPPVRLGMCGTSLLRIGNRLDSNVVPAGDIFLVSFWGGISSRTMGQGCICIGGYRIQFLMLDGKLQISKE